MKNIIILQSFELNNKNLLGDWKKMSDRINLRMKEVDGFIYRDSSIGDDGKVYCIVKWENVEKQNNFSKILQSDAFINEMIEFARIVNMETRKSKVLEVI